MNAYETALCFFKGWLPAFYIRFSKNKIAKSGTESGKKQANKFIMIFEVCNISGWLAGVTILLTDKGPRDIGIGTIFGWLPSFLPVRFF